MNNDIDIINDLKCPKFAAIYKRQLRLDMFDKEIEEEKNQEILLDKLQCRHEITKIQNKKVMEYLIEKIDENRKYINEINQFMDEYQKESQELYNNLCHCMLIDPRGTFEIILQAVERNEKIKDNSGDSWKWTLKFNFFTRLRMALKLIFG